MAQKQNYCGCSLGLRGAFEGGSHPSFGCWGLPWAGSGLLPGLGHAGCLYTPLDAQSTVLGRFGKILQPLPLGIRKAS
jgi:hypothetical protein